MPITSEIVNPSDVEMMSKYVDMFQIGARNMQNFNFLKAVGKMKILVLLAGLSATIGVADGREYLMASGTDQVISANRVFEPTNGRHGTRWTSPPFRSSRS